MMVRKIVSLACITTAVVSVAACRDRNLERERMGEQTYGQTTVTGAAVVANTTAVERVVTARCEREAACKNVGVDRRFANTAACHQKLRSDMREDLNTKDCPTGVDQKELTECLDEIRREDCNNPIDTINRLAACRTGDLCLKSR